MKKLSICFSLLLAASMVLCACGKKVEPSPTPVVTASPHVTEDIIPETDNGVVSDGNIPETKVPETSSTPKAK